MEASFAVFSCDEVADFDLSRCTALVVHYNFLNRIRRCFQIFSVCDVDVLRSAAWALFVEQPK
jgi:hypothetical protein